MISIVKNPDAPSRHWKEDRYLVIKRLYVYIMTEELFIREIRIDKAAGRDDSDSRMTRFEVIMPLKLQSTM